MSYFQRYLKYKHKYLTLKSQYQNQSGGAIELDSLSDSELDTKEKQINFQITEGAQQNSDNQDESQVSSVYTVTEENKQKNIEEPTVAQMVQSESLSDISVTEDSEVQQSKLIDSQNSTESSSEKSTASGNSTESSSEKSTESNSSEKSTASDASENKNFLTDTDSELTSTDSLDNQEGGGRFFNHVMEQLSSSVRSYDLQKGNFDSELSSLSEFNI